MPYLPDINTYLHNSSLLIQAYPTTRITTKYSVPRRPNTHSKREKPSKRSLKAASTSEPTDSAAQPTQATQREKKEPSATLTLKTFHPESGICLKYRTDKAQEVGRLMAGLGRLAQGEVIEIPSATEVKAGGDAMEVDSGALNAVKVEDKVAAAAPVSQQTQGGQQQQGGGGGGKKKKKGKK
jgi:hypothetical protein